MAAVSVTSSTFAQGTGAEALVAVPAGLTAEDKLLLFVVSSASSITFPTGWSSSGYGSSVESVHGTSMRAIGVVRKWTDTVGASVAVQLGSSAPWTVGLVAVRGVEVDEDPVAKIGVFSSGASSSHYMSASGGMPGLFHVGFVAAVPRSGAAGVSLTEITTVLTGDASVTSTAGACPAATAGWAQKYSGASLGTVEFGTSDSGVADWIGITFLLTVRTALSAQEATVVEISNPATGFESTNITLVGKLPDYAQSNALWWTYTPASDALLTITVVPVVEYDSAVVYVYEDTLPSFDPATQGVTTNEISSSDTGSVQVQFTAGHQYWILVTSTYYMGFAIQSVSFMGESAQVEITQLEPDFNQLRFSMTAVGTMATVAPQQFQAPVTRQIKRVSNTWPASPSNVTKGGSWLPTGSPVIEDWGTFALVIDGQELTTFRGVPVEIVKWIEAEPFGPGNASLSVPSIIPIKDKAGVDDLTWLVAGSAVDIYRLHPDGTTKTLMWGGEIVSWDWGYDENSRMITVECQGAVWAGAGNQQYHAPMWRDSTDRGTVIADTLNNIKSRRYAAVSRVTTGIYTTQLGSWESKAIDYVQELLSEMTVAAGDSQWTVAAKDGSPRHYQIRTKNTTTIAATFRAGQPGITVDLSKDFTTCPNVIYGWGISSSGAGWGNWFFPGTSQDDAPAYPFSDTGKVISVGGHDRDSETDSGDGVTRWQRRMRELGYRSLDDDGVYSSTDAKYCRRMQARYGVQVDGVVGPQTWAATFGVGSGADVGEPIRLPLARNTKTAKHWYNADGSVRQANPNYDPGFLIVETDIAFGSGVSKNEGIDAADAMLARMPDPGWCGKIVVTGDPPEGSRFEVLRAGRNLKLCGWNGADQILHIVQVEVNPSDLSVTCEVDTRFRDLLNLVQIKQRNRVNPRPGRRRSRALSTRDSVVTFDGESRGGIIPSCALFGGLWTVLKIPLAQLGNLAKVRFRTFDSPSRFAVALFGAKVQAEDLVDLVGNPLAERYGYGPFDKKIEDLDDFWFIEAWGQHGQACGYYPGAESSDTDLTGYFLDTGGVEFQVKRPPWIYVALYAEDSCRINGRLYPAAWEG
jgi:hypothetical protein